MGLFSKLFPKSAVTQATDGYFKTLTAYSPTFTSFGGGVYEAELCRAAIHTTAIHCSKLKPEIIGAANPRLKNILAYQPNPYMDTTKFLYKIATILETENTAFIIPLYDKYGRINGLYPVRPSTVSILEYRGEPYLQYSFATGERATEELSRCGILNKFFYKDDFFGENNAPLRATLDLINTENQAITEGVKQSATIRFIAMLAQTFRPEDIEKERARFAAENLGITNNGGVMMGDAKYSSITPIDSKPYIVPDKQVELIRQNVYNYFNINENIITSDYSDDQFNAFYESKIEPFALQLSLVLTNMIFSDKEKAFGNEIQLTANRLQQASTTAKLEVVTQLVDRGLITLNQGREIFNLPKTEDGDKYYIRQEYAEVKRLNEAQGLEEPALQDETKEGEE